MDLTLGHFEKHFNHVRFFFRSRDSSVVYNDWLLAGRPGNDSRQGQNFSLLRSNQFVSGAHSTSYPMGSSPISQRLNGTKREGGHSVPSSAGGKNGGAITSTPENVFMV